MFDVIEREMIVPNLHLLTLRVPEIAEQIQPGQFVIVRSSADAERIPLSVADFDRKKGTITIIFMEVGASTAKMASLKSGEAIPSVVGPLGKFTKIEKFGTVLCVGGCFGIGSIFPIVRALHEKGNRIIVALEARSKNLLYWEDKIRPFCTRLITITSDGSAGEIGHVKQVGEILKKEKIKPDHIIANGCTYLVYRVSKDFSHFNVPIIVSLNTTMIDGTGMCGVYRETVDG